MLLPKDPLCGQLITITSGPYKIQSFPVAITDTKYKQQRNEFRFNVCWVFDRWKYEGGEFESVVKKVAKVLKACEVSSVASILSSVFPLGCVVSQAAVVPDCHSSLSNSPVGLVPLP